MSPARVDRPARLGFVLAAVIVTQLLVVIDFFALNLTLPPMAHDFGVSPTDLQFVISGYMIALGAFMIPAGRIADLVGRRRVTVVGVVVFGLSSLVCGVAPDEKVVIVFRVIEGIGAAMCFPVSIALITATFPADRVQRTLGVVYGFAALGNALGPLVGGLLSEVSWRWVFLVNVPLAAVAAVWLQTSVPETVDETASKRIDWLGVGLVSSGLIVTTLAVDNADDWGWGSARTLGVLVCGLALLAAFLVVETRVEAPLVDLSLFREKAYAVIVSAGTVANCAFVVAIFAATLLLQNVRLLSPALSALAFLPMAIGCAVAGQTAGRLGRARPQWVAAGALAVGGLGLLILSTSASWGAFLPGFRPGRARAWARLVLRECGDSGRGPAEQGCGRVRGDTDGSNRTRRGRARGRGHGDGPAGRCLGGTHLRSHPGRAPVHRGGVPGGRRPRPLGGVDATGRSGAGANTVWAAVRRGAGGRGFAHGGAGRGAAGRGAGRPVLLSPPSSAAAPAPHDQAGP